MAYAALRSLAQILHQTLNRDYQYLILDEKQQIESLVEIITAIQKDFSSQKITQYEESEIRVAAYIVEDIIESRIIERFRTESAGNEDGSTEKKLVRFNVIENWIVASSNSASSSFGQIGLEIVGVGGVEKPRTRQNINGIRQLARTFRFKAWFLHSNVLHGNSAPFPDAIWTLERLANHGTEIVIIDTYSMGTSATMEELSSFGFDTSLFVGAITSEDLSPGPSPRPCVTRFDNNFGDATEEYKSPMVMAMAGVDADRCIVVTRDFDHIKVANTAGISSILIAKNAGIYSILRNRRFGRRFSKRIYGPNVVRYLAATYDAHPTYVLPSFTW